MTVYQVTADAAWAYRDTANSQSMRPISASDIGNMAAIIRDSKVVVSRTVVAIASPNTAKILRPVAE